MEDGLGVGRVVVDAQNFGAAFGAHLQGDGAGQAGMPDDETGIGGSDQQRIIHVTDTAGDLLGQQRTGDQAKAPVQPAANGRHEGNDEDRALLVLCAAGDGAQHSLTGRRRSHCRAQHQNQRHLHGEGQQAPEALGVAPGLHQFDGTQAGADHRAHKGHDGQNDGKQEGIGQPAVHNMNAGIGKPLEHLFFLLFFKRSRFCRFPFYRKIGRWIWLISTFIICSFSKKSTIFSQRYKKIQKKPISRRIRHKRLQAAAFSRTI